MNSGHAWVTKRKEHDARPLAYGTVLCLTGQSSGSTAQCAYIGFLIEPS